MPELPEVETIMTLVKKTVENKKIKKTKVLNPKLRWPIDVKKVEGLDNKTIRSVFRRGKYIIIEFNSKEEILVIHLGMTGVISFNNIKDYIKHKHDHFLLFFSDFMFVFNDVRKFGSIHICHDLEKMFLIKNLGVEPLSNEFNTKYLYELSKNSSWNREYLCCRGIIFVKDSSWHEN